MLIYFIFIDADIFHFTKKHLRDLLQTKDTILLPYSFFSHMDRNTKYSKEKKNMQQQCSNCFQIFSNILT